MTKRVRDAELKAMILRSVQAGNRKSRQIYNSINYDGYDNFKSELSMLKRRGYLSRRGKPPYDWVLTKKGRRHAEDPYISMRRREAALQHIKDSFLEDDERFEEALADWVRRHPESPMVQIVPETKVVNSETPIILTDGTTTTVNEIETKLHEAERKLQNSNERIEELNMIVQSNQKRERQKIQTENTVMADRAELTDEYYRKKYLDIYFFKKLGYFLYPMKHTKLWNKGSIELLRPGEAEVKGREHVRDPLTPEEILEGRFEIVDKTNTYIKIFGRGMKTPKKIDFVTQKMVSQTDTRTGRKEKVPRGTGQITRIAPTPPKWPM